MKKGITLGKVIKALILLITSLIIILPFWLFLMTSLRDKTVLFETPPKLWVENPTLDNYAELLLSKTSAFPTLVCQQSDSIRNYNSSYPNPGFPRGLCLCQKDISGKKRDLYAAWRR